VTDQVRIATRGSALARWQAERVLALLGGSGELVVVQTAGDQDTSSAIHALGGTGVFVKEVQDAVLHGHADIAVHSAKDLPALTPEGLVLAAVPERADPRDALVGARLADLPTGARIGTGSVRRRAQLAWLRHDLRFGELRGNLSTRLDKAEQYDAIVVAQAALERLGVADRAAEVLEPSVMLPQVAQGALGVECRADDDRARAALDAIDNALAHAEVRAERAFLEELGGGCDLPCGALATAAPDATIHLSVLLASLDGHVVLRASGTGTDPELVGHRCATDLLDREGGRALLSGLVPEPR
jgi:hydroxymethylbilane synthase